MSALTADAKREKRGTLLRDYEVVAAADVLYAGAAAVGNAAGYAAPATAASGDRMLGIISEQCDNSAGSAGDLKAKIEAWSHARWTGSGFTQADVGEDAYFSDDNLITLTRTACYAGVVDEYISTTELWINHIPAYGESDNFNLGDNQVLSFGDASDIVMSWDGTDFDITAATANSAINIGVDGAGLDLKLFGDTASSYALWDQSADKLIFDGADIGLLDADILEFGDAQDVTMTWDGTQFVIDALTADSAIFVGVDGAGLDLKLFGDTASSYLLWDQSADKLTINAGTADLGTSCEADAYTVGGAAGIDHGPADITSITVVKGIVTAITSV